MVAGPRPAECPYARWHLNADQAVAVQAHFKPLRRADPVLGHRVFRVKVQIVLSVGPKLY